MGGVLGMGEDNSSFNDVDTNEHTITPSDLYLLINEINQMVDNFIFKIESEDLLQNLGLEDYWLDIDDSLVNLISYFSPENQENYIFTLDLNIFFNKLKKIKMEFPSVLVEGSERKVKDKLQEILFQLNELETILSYKKSINDLAIIDEESKIKFDKLEDKLRKSDLLVDDLRNLKTHEIYNNEVGVFNKFARNYEMAFYILMGCSAFYFLGLTFYINEINLFFITIGFPEKIHGSLNYEFYVQKISLLILTTTIAAFLLKRSFMNRRLADEAYRTAKELDALPRYLEGMPEELRDKIRFDLAYKYFGNSVHHESYTGGENLMHENIKANTDFIKAVKDLSPKTEKTEKDKSE